jgi:NADH:ubiquinone oxidoreductase subunit D
MYRRRTTMPTDMISKCCGVAIERRYYRFGGVSCAPDDADYTDRVCRECGKSCDIAEEEKP